MSSMLHVRMDEELKAEGNRALEAMGLTAAEAVRLLHHRIVADQALLLELKVPNAATRAAVAEADGMLAERRARFGDAGAVISSLDE